MLLHNYSFYQNLGVFNTNFVRYGLSFIEQRKFLFFLLITAEPFIWFNLMLGILRCLPNRDYPLPTINYGLLTHGMTLMYSEFERAGREETKREVEEEEVVEEELMDNFK